MKERYISRVDSFKSGMFGYLLRLYGGKSVVYQEWFSDKVYGSKANALQAAIQKRDQKMKELNYQPGGSRKTRKWKPVQSNRKPTSNTGILGVYESCYSRKRKNGSSSEYHYFAVSYVEEKGKSKIKRFYINRKQSREEALEKAIKFRRERELSARMAAVDYNRAREKEQIELENKLAAIRRRQAGQKVGRGRGRKKV